jgi:zinc transport system substrate-binding protein
VHHVSLAAASAAVYPDLTTVDGGRDAHIWLSPRRVKVMVNEIAATLSTLYPDGAEEFYRNAAAYCAEVDAADARIRTMIAESGMTDFIVYHPAFSYLADEYGLTMHALEKEGSEPTAAHLAAMAKLARDRNIRIVFYQAESDARRAEAFAAEIGGRAVELSPLHGDYIENLEMMAAAIAAAGEE